ncbi:DUF423 domain-containing protein [Desertivirga arenae]|uniref:DUF423 domain-containing protein n=1 Tax=Desertivirga arenae TaxID=2810309 RepID=UPI001A956B73|nr:DUF423 domain-containing protein [Pedobacter sp. SYSU D00823]
MNRKILITASIFGALAVILGAFGAHGLKAHLTSQDLENWRTAVSYHFYHTLALLFLSLLSPKSRLTTLAFWAFSIGIILFSGSIYLLSTRAITGLNLPFLGPITPLGGLLFIVGWVCLLVTGLRTGDARV